MNGFFAPLLVVLLTPLAALQAQSLAAVAQRAADERAAKANAATTPPAKVYTNEDVGASPPPVAVVKPNAAPAKTTMGQREIGVQLSTRVPASGTYHRR